MQEKRQSLDSAGGQARLRLTLLPMLQEEGYIQVQEKKTDRKVIKDCAAALVDYGLVLVNGQLRPHGWRLDFDMTRRIKKSA